MGVVATALFSFGLPPLEASWFSFQHDIRSRPAATMPPQAQVINQKDFNVLQTVLPPAESNGTIVRTP